MGHVSGVFRKIVNKPYLGKFWHHFYGKYKKLSTKLITLTCCYKMFLKIIQQPMLLDIR